MIFMDDLDVLVEDIVPSVYAALNAVVGMVMEWREPERMCKRGRWHSRPGSKLGNKNRSE